jgi:heat shock protein HslJ
MGSGLMRALVLALALMGCASAAVPPAPHNYLAGTSWRRVDDENASPHDPTIAFEQARASGFSGCNRWFASVTHDGESLTFGDVGMTRMACTAEPAMAAERNFLEVLEATRYAHYDDAALVLLDAEQNQIARFERE